MNSSRVGQFIRRIPLHLVVIAIAVTWFVPSLGLLVSSFRPPREIATSGWWTAFQPPIAFTIELYVEALTREGMAQSFVNSLFISIPATVVPIMVAAFAAYAFAWMEFPGRHVLFILVIGLLVVPLQMTFIPILRVYNIVGLTGSFAGIWLAHAAYGLPFSIYLLRNFFGSLPKDLFDSAFIDGASSFDIFFRIVLPLSIPSLA
jgi:alpha-glucoside transport system permease protein